jgi:hypothetical protein
MKLFKTLGTWIIVIVLLLLWHHYLVSSRLPKLKAWESCKENILEDWTACGGSVPENPEVRRAFVRDHFYSFAATSSSPNKFDDHDSRNTAVSDAARIGVTEDSLVIIDLVIANKCGAFPRQ